MKPQAATDLGDAPQLAKLLDSLGADWTERSDAVHGLTSGAEGDLLHRLLAVVREEHRDLSRLNAALQILAHTPADVVPELNRLLAHSDHEVRAYAALALGERADPRAVEPLVAALSDPNANVQAHAIEALGKLRAGAAVDKLMDFVEAENFELAFPAIDALIAIGDRRVAARLLPLLQNPLLQVVAVQALGALGDETVVKPLLSILADREVPAAEVATALVRIHRRYQQSYGDVTTIPAAIQSRITPAEVETLIAAVPAMSPASSADGPTLLSWLPGPSAELALVRSLERSPIGDELVSAIARKGPAILPLVLERFADASDEAKKAIIEIAAQIGDRGAVPVLLQALAEADEDDVLVRLCDAFGRLRDARAYEALRELFGHGSGFVRQAAVAAVSSLSHPDTARDLLAGLQDRAPEIRESNLKVAACLGPASCFDAVLACCDDAEPRVRVAAVESLPAFDDHRVVQRLIQAMRSDTPAVRAAAAGALPKVGETAAVARLLADAFHDNDVWVRYFAVRSLQAIHRHVEFCGQLTQLARKDPAMQVRLAAVEALADCGDAALSVLLELQHDRDDELDGAALGALGAVSHPDAHSALVKALDSPIKERLIQAVRALGRTRSPESVEPLRGAALKMDEGLAKEAIDALGQLGRSEAAAALIQLASRPRLRDECLRALANMSAAAVAALARGLQEAGLDERRVIVEALCRIGQPAAVQALELALNDSDPGVRQAAFSSLAHIRSVPRTANPVPACEGEF